MLGVWIPGHKAASAAGWLRHEWGI